MRIIKKHISEVSKGDVIIAPSGAKYIAAIDAFNVGCRCGREWRVLAVNADKSICISAFHLGPDGMIDVVKTYEKHISKVVKDDTIVFYDELCQAVSDAYFTKTDNGREWNVEVKGGTPDTNYIYASDVECGMLNVFVNDDNNDAGNEPCSVEFVPATTTDNAQTWQEAVKNLADTLGWSATVDDKRHEWEFEICSDAGRDFVVSVQGETLDALSKNLYERLNGYDVCEETYIWLDETGHGKNGAPYDMMDVYQDSEQCKEMLGTLLDVVRTLSASRSVG